MYMLLVAKCMTPNESLNSIVFPAEYMLKTKGKYKRNRTEQIPFLALESQRPQGDGAKRQNQEMTEQHRCGWRFLPH